MNDLQMIAIWKQAWRGRSQQPDLKNKELVLRVHDYRELLGAAALPESYNLFASEPTNTFDWSLNRPGKLDDPVAVYAIGIDFEGDDVDYTTVIPNSKVHLKVGNRSYPECHCRLCPAGGGISGAFALDGAAAAAVINRASNGVPAHGALFPISPVPIPDEQTFHLNRTSKSGLTVVTASVFCGFLYTVEAIDIVN